MYIQSGSRCYDTNRAYVDVRARVGGCLDTDLGTADLEQVDGLAADVDVVSDVSEEGGDAGLGLPGDEGVALHPEVLVWGRGTRRQLLFQVYKRVYLERV